MGWGILIWIIGDEAKGYITTRVDLDDVATDGSCGGVNGRSTVHASISRRALYYLEIVTVQMKRMAASVEVVDYDFDCVIIVYHMRVGSLAIDDWVRGSFPDSQGSIERGYFRLDVGNVVDCEPEPAC